MKHKHAIARWLWPPYSLTNLVAASIQSCQLLVATRHNAHDFGSAQLYVHTGLIALRLTATCVMAISPDAPLAGSTVRVFKRMLWLLVGCPPLQRLLQQLQGQRIDSVPLPSSSRPAQHHADYGKGQHSESAAAARQSAAQSTTTPVPIGMLLA